MLVKGAYSKLLGEGLAKQFKVAYSDTSNARFKPYINKKYALGFRITKELIEDDLYGGKVKKRKKYEVTVKYEIELDAFHTVTMQNNDITFPSYTFTLAELPHVIKTLKTIAKANTPIKKVRRRRRIKK